MTHVRIRCTGLIIENDAILLVKYDDYGVHYNLPGGGLEPGETIKEGVAREVREETAAEVEVGQLALIYELAPHKQSGDYSIDEKHAVNLIFECILINGSIPHMPNIPDPLQVGVTWVPIKELDSILLIPNIKEQIKLYIANERKIDLIEDFQLERLLLPEQP